jgi:hypothetical protein
LWWWWSSSAGPPAAEMSHPRVAYLNVSLYTAAATDAASRAQLRSMAAAMVAANGSTATYAVLAQSECASVVAAPTALTPPQFPAHGVTRL